MSVDHSFLLKELLFSTSRSGGAGGQHVNKVESKVSLFWNLATSMAVSHEQRARLQERLRTRLTKDGVLQLDASTTRSQLKNKELVVERFLRLIDDSLTPKKKRLVTKVPKSQVLERLDRKKRNASKKVLRGKVNLD